MLRNLTLLVGAWCCLSSPAQPAPHPLPPGFRAVGDMIIREAPGQSGVAVVELWPGVVPYAFDSGLTAFERDQVRAAMDTIEAVAALSFVPRTSEADYLLFFEGTGNSSYLGRVGGTQPISIVTWSSEYVIVHELMHALGFIHEHQRTDRDAYVEVQWENVDPQFASNFEIITASTTIGPYDHDSVMHYPRCAFSVCECLTCGMCGSVCDTLTVRWPDGDLSDAIGQRDELSAGDAWELGYLYGVADCDTSGTHDFDDVLGGAPDCDGNGVPDACEIATGALDDCNGNGTPDRCEAGWDCNGNDRSDWCDIALGSSLDTNADDVPDECEVPAILRVTAQAAGGGDGGSWSTPLTLREAFALCASVPGAIDEVWVAAGVYTPGDPNGPRSAAFHLVDGAALYGGFAGTETERSARDPNANPTVLSGDLLSNDAPGGNREDNTHHVVIADPNDGPTTLLDGFVIRGGQADGAAAAARNGAGLLLAGPVMIRNCAVTDNHADPVSGTGGGVAITADNALLLGCRIRGNSAGSGGGVCVEGERATLVNCLLTGNTAVALHGGGIAGYESRTAVINCTIYGNAAISAGGAGGAVAAIVESRFRIVNSIVWGNHADGSTSETDQLGVVVSGSYDVGYTCIENLGGTFAGGGNIGSDPNFVDAGGGVFMLRSGSACIDAGDSDSLPMDASDADGDGNVVERVPLDLAGGPRLIDLPRGDTGQGSVAYVDLGAFELQLPPCPGDTNGDRVLDLTDLGTVLGGFGQNGSALPGDVDNDGDVDLSDLGVILAGFGGTCP